MSDDEPKDESTDDSEQQSNEQTAESDQPAEQSEEQPADTDQAVDQPEEQPAEGDQPAEQSEEQPAESDQPAEQVEEQSADSGQAAGEGEEQPTDSDQSAEQSEEQRADGDQPAEQSEGEVAEGDQPAEHPEEQPPESDQSETSASADDTLAFAGDAASPAGGGGGSHQLKVEATFTMGGKQFIGDIKIFLFEYDEKGMSSQVWAQKDWQPPTKNRILDRKGNVITTPLVRFTTSKLAITANARIILGEPDTYQRMSQEFVFPMPSGDTLRTKFDLGEGKVDETVTAPTPAAATGKVSQLSQFKGRFVDLVAKPIGNQQFRVTGRYATGTISSADGTRLGPIQYGR
jgi:hypothetical protein